MTLLVKYNWQVVKCMIDNFINEQQFVQKRKLECAGMNDLNYRLKL